MIQDPPPSYLAIDVEPDHFIPPNISPANYLSLQRTGSAVKGAWIIDPAMSVPEALLPPVEHGTTRPNVQLESRGGPVNAELWLLPRLLTTAKRPPRAMLNLTSYSDDVRIRLVSAALTAMGLLSTDTRPSTAQTPSPSASSAHRMAAV